MTSDSTVETGMMDPEPKRLGEETMILEACWAEIRRLHHTERLPIAEIARRLDLDRTTVRRALHQAQWQPDQRPPRADTLLAAQAAWLRTRAPRCATRPRSSSRSCVSSAATGAAPTP